MSSYLDELLSTPEDTTPTPVGGDYLDELLGGQEEDTGRVLPVSPGPSVGGPTPVPQPSPEEGIMPSLRVEPPTPQAPWLSDEVRKASGLRSTKHQPELRWFKNLIEDGRWAVGLAASGLRVGSDVLFAWTQGEYESDPEKFQARTQRGKDVFSLLRGPSIEANLRIIETIQDPIKRARALEEYADSAGINDATDLLTKPATRAALAEINYGIEQAPPYLSAFEMIFDNHRTVPALGGALGLAATTNGIIHPKTITALTFEAAKELRKDPTEVTLGDVSSMVLDKGLRGWISATAPIVKRFPETRETLQYGVPAVGMAVGLTPVEVYYDPAFILSESKIAQGAARLGFKGVSKMAQAATKAGKAGVGAAAEAIAKRRAAKVSEEVVEKAPLITPPPTGEVVVSIPKVERTLGAGLEEAMTTPTTNPRLLQLREKFQRNPVGKNLRYRHVSLNGLNRVVETGKIRPNPEAPGEIFITRTDVSRLGRQEKGYLAGQAKGFPFQGAFGPVRFVFDVDDLKVKGIKPTPKDKGALKSLKYKTKVTESEAEEVFKLNEVDVENVLRVEIDPSAFATRGEVETLDASRTLVLNLAQQLEAKGVPVVIKPFFAQSQVKAYRPAVSVAKIPERLIRGPEPTTSLTHPLIAISGITGDETATAVEKAVPFLRDVEIPVDRRVGGIVQDLGLEHITDPEELGRLVAERTLPPGASKELLKFGPQGPMFPGQYELWSKPGQLSLFEEVAPTIPRGKAEAPLTTKQLRKQAVSKEVQKRTAVREAEARRAARKGSVPPPPRWVHQLDLWDEPPPPPRAIIDPTRLLAGKSSFTQPSDISLAERNLLGQRFVLYEDPGDQLSRGIYLTERRSHFRAAERANEHAQVFKGMNELLRKAGARGYQKLSHRLTTAINARPNEIAAALKNLPKEERRVALQVRSFVEGWLKGHGYDARTARRGILEEAGFRIWPTSEFIIENAEGKLVRAAFPGELTDIPIQSNVVFRHVYPGMKPDNDIVSAMRALSAGMIREDILKPAWKQMDEAANGVKIPGQSQIPNLPPRKRDYVNLWLKNLRGVPSAWEQTFDHLTMAVKADNQMGLRVNPVTEAASYVRNAYYRSHLFGNANTFFGNFFDQGFAGTAARDGVFATFEGIARQYKHAFDGASRPVFMGSWDALFGREVPHSAFGLKLRSLPGVKQFRNFWNEVMEPNLGMTGSELQIRSIGMHVGLKNALDRYNIRTGNKLTWQQVLKREGVPDGLHENLMFEAMMDSDQVAHIHGVSGTNPALRHFFGPDLISTTTQFMSYFPKKGEFLLGPLVKRGDPGIITNYFLLTGWLANLATKSWGIDYMRSAWWSALPQAGPGSGAPIPSSPAVDAAWILLQAVGEDDPVQEKRHWEEFGRHLEALTGIPALTPREKAEVFWRMLETGGLYTPTRHFNALFGITRPEELLAFSGPTAAEQQGPVFGEVGGYDPNPENLERNIINIVHSETLARVMGYPTVSDRNRRRIETESRRMNRTWTSLMGDLSNAIIVEIQDGRGPNKQVPKGGPRYQELIAEAKRQGLPIDAMVRDQVLDICLPRILRIFQDSKKLTKQQIAKQLQQEYPDYFANPRRIWDKIEEGPEPMPVAPGSDYLEELGP